MKNSLIVTDATLVRIGLLTAMRDKLTASGVAWPDCDGVQPDPTIAQAPSSPASGMSAQSGLRTKADTLRREDIQAISDAALAEAH